MNSDMALKPVAADVSQNYVTELFIMSQSMHGDLHMSQKMVVQFSSLFSPIFLCINSFQQIISEYCI